MFRFFMILISFSCFGFQRLPTTRSQFWPFSLFAWFWSCADEIFYRLFEPTLEIHPCTGAEKHGGSVGKSTCPPESQWPVALVKRPVPPVTSEVSWLSYTPGVPDGLRYPSKVPESSSPLAAKK